MKIVKLIPFTIMLILLAFQFSCQAVNRVPLDNDTQLSVKQEEPKALEELLNNLANQILASLPDPENKKIAITDFLELDGSVTHFGLYLSEQLITRLYGRVIVVERKLLDEVISEQKTQLSGIVDETSAKEIGRILGVDSIAIGTIINLGDKVEVNARLICTETGKVLGTGRIVANSTDDIKTLMQKIAYNGTIKGKKSGTAKNISPESLSFQVNFVYRTAGLGELKPLRNGEVLESGDHYKIIFNPDKDCFVYVFQVDSVGQVFQLFPMESFGGVYVGNRNPVRLGQTYTLPSADRAFVLDRQIGLERIYFVFSKTRDREIEGIYEELLQARSEKEQTRQVESQNKLKKHFKRRGMAGIVTDRAINVSWQDKGDIFSIMGQRFENMSDDCIHVLEFIHN